MSLREFKRVQELQGLSKGVYTVAWRNLCVPDVVLACPYVFVRGGGVGHTAEHMFL